MEHGESVSAFPAALPLRQVRFAIIIVKIGISIRKAFLSYSVVFCVLMLPCCCRCRFSFIFSVCVLLFLLLSALRVLLYFLMSLCRSWGRFIKTWVGFVIMCVVIALVVYFTKYHQ